MNNPETHMNTEAEREVRSPGLTHGGERPPDIDPNAVRPMNREFVVLGLGTMALLCAALLVLVVIVSRGDPSLPAPPASCSQGGKSLCENGFICTAGGCVQEQVYSCAGGKGCNNGACSCPNAQICREDRCVESTISAKKCSDPATQKLVRWLIDKCEKNGGKGTSCPAGDWEKFAIASDTFDAMLAGAAEGISIHFPWAVPSIQPGAPPWPGAEKKAYYLAELKKSRKAVDEAKLIFIVGRASKGGSSAENKQYGTLRWRAATTLLAGLYDDQPVGVVDEFNKKLRYVVLGDARQLPAGFYTQYFHERMIAWSDEETSRLARDVKDPLSQSDQERGWTVNTLNQVALIIPIPCDGTEAP